MGYSFRLTARVLLYAASHNMIAHTTAFVTPVMEHWLEREIYRCKKQFYKNIRRERCFASFIHYDVDINCTRSSPLTSLIHFNRKKKDIFNDALNTFYLQLYCVRHMVKDHSDSMRGNLLSD